MLNLGSVNWLAVVIATVVHQVLGFLWYGPLFGRQWTEAMGKPPEEMGNPRAAITVSMVCAVVMAAAMGLLLTLPPIVNTVVGVVVGLVAGLGFVAATAVTGNAFEGGSRKVLVIGLGYQVVGLMIMGGIIGTLPPAAVMSAP